MNLYEISAKLKKEMIKIKGTFSFIEYMYDSRLFLSSAVFLRSASFLSSASNLFFASEYNSFDRIVPAPVVFSTTYIYLTYKLNYAVTTIASNYEATIAHLQWDPKCSFLEHLLCNSFLSITLINGSAGIIITIRIQIILTVWRTISCPCFRRGILIGVVTL